MHNQLFAQLLTLLTTAVAAVALFHRLRLPAVLAYLAVGLVLGPLGLSLGQPETELHFLAEFGVVFLLFTTGLEFSIPQMMAMGRDVVGLGGGQVVTTALSCGLIAFLWGATPEAAFLYGGALAMSSTAVVVRQLVEQGEVQSIHGRLAVAVLLFQDLAVIPFLIVVPVLTGSSDSVIGELLLALAKGALAAGILLGGGHWLLRPLFHEVARTRSGELFTLTALAVVLSAAALTHILGLSLSLGAFLAGMTLAETEYRHQVEADLRPFRDALMGLFFISVGMLLDLTTLPALLPQVVALALGLLLLKAALVVWVTRLLGHNYATALRTGLILAQGGEFGFALLALGLASQLLEPVTTQVVLGASLLTLVAAPFLVRHHDELVKRFGHAPALACSPEALAQVADAAQGLEDHVVLCGYGRTGQSVAHFLEREGWAYVALDMDPDRIQEARAAGEPVRFGDSSRREILEAAGVSRAHLVVVTHDDLATTLKLLAAMRTIDQRIPVVVRTRLDVNMQRLQDAGAAEVIPETLEASLMLASEVLLRLGVPTMRVLRHAQAARVNGYRLLRGYFHGREPTAAEQAGAYPEQLHAVTVTEGSFATGRTLGELDFHHCGVDVTAVRRGGIRGPDPGESTRLRAGDVLILYGDPEALARAEVRLLSG